MLRTLTVHFGSCNQFVTILHFDNNKRWKTAVSIFFSFASPSKRNQKTLQTVFRRTEFAKAYTMLSKITTHSWRFSSALYDVLLYLFLPSFPWSLCTVLSSKESVACASASNNKYVKSKFIGWTIAKKKWSKLNVHQKRCTNVNIELIAYEYGVFNASNIGWNWVYNLHLLLKLQTWRKNSKKNLKNNFKMKPFYGVIFARCCQ